VCLFEQGQRAGEVALFQQVHAAIVRCLPVQIGPSKRSHPFKRRPRKTKCARGRTATEKYSTYTQQSLYLHDSLVASWEAAKKSTIVLGRIDEFRTR
jgi:hypothetical protein